MNKYHVVYEFCIAAEDFVIRGIYTKESDAAEHVQNIKGDVSKYKGSCASIELDHETLVRRLTDERLGVMASALKSLIYKS